MTKSYNRPGFTTRVRQLALATLLTGSVSAAYAQTYPAGNVINTTGTYTDLGTSGTTITTANTDDASSAATAIGFPFSFYGVVFNDFVLNTNGYLKLGTTAPVAPFFNDGGLATTGGPTQGADNNLILPFNGDLTAGTGTPEYRVSTTGNAGSQVTTIQWKNVSDKARIATATSAAIGVQYTNFSFQVKLYEGSNRIEFSYGTATAGAVATENPKIFNVGLKGASSAAADMTLGFKASAEQWNATTFIAGVYTGNGHNIRRSVLPDPGRTYRFIPVLPNDAAVQTIYGFDKLLVPGGQPVVISAAIRNAGSAALSNIAVTLNITGANTATATATVATLAGGAAGGAITTVAFPAVSLPNAGANTVTVSTSIPNDDNTGNDTKAMAMETNTTTTGFITPNVPASSGIGFASGREQYFGVKISLNTPRDIIAVNAYIGDASPTTTQKSTVGETLYGVVVDATTGALLGRSRNFVVTAADVDVVHTFTLSAPVPVTAGDVIVGMVAIAPASNGALTFYPMGVQREDPSRPDTYYNGVISATPTAPAPALNTAPLNVYKYMLEGVTSAPATCAAPSAITSTNTATAATISFTGPANGTSYEIIYGTAGFDPATAGTTTPAFTTSTYTIPGLSGATCYDFYVRAICSPTDRSAAAGPISICTPCVAPIINSYPYVQNFDVITTGQTLPCGIQVQDTNADGYTWEALATVPTSPVVTIGNGGTGNAMVYIFNDATTTIGGDDWFYTPALRMTGGRAYYLSFNKRAGNGGYPEGLEVKYGTTATPAGQTTTIYSNTNIINTTYNAATGITSIVPSATGTYYIGFHAISAADKFFLAVDDVVVTDVLASSPALTRAINLFPNPSNTGQFNLEVRGANASQGLNVEVTNMLGQSVYTGKAKDNFTNTLNLSSLASGIYTLKVKNGSEYTVQQISIVK